MGLKSIKVKISILVTSILVVSVAILAVIMITARYKDTMNNLIELAHVSIKPVNVLATSSVAGANLMKLKSNDAIEIYKISQALEIDIEGMSDEMAKTVFMPAQPPKRMRYNYKSTEESYSRYVQLAKKSSEEVLFLDNYMVIKTKLGAKNGGTVIAVFSAKKVKSLLSDLMIKFTLIITPLVLIATLIGIYLSSKMAKDIIAVNDGLEDFFKYINHDSDSAELIDVDTTDEIGQMAQSINDNIKKIEENYKIDKDLIDEASSVISKVNNGHFDVKILSNTENGSLNELKDNVNTMLEVLNANVSRVLKLLDLYSNGDYQKSCQIKSDGQFQELIDGVNHLGSSIKDMLNHSNDDAIKLQNNAQTLEDNVKEITTSAGSQAVAIDQSTQSVNHVSQIIESNHNRSNTMSELASKLRTLAESGDELAKQTNSSMDEIDESTNNIVEAISIINQIAFQTNILSLNAAVEAATAGEAGKGFAVVAGEVRNLASRSADAAKTIEELVKSAQNKTSEGKVITSKMIEGFNSLSNTISDTHKEITEVTKNSAEQISAIEELNEAMGNISKIAQNTKEIAQDTNEIASSTQQQAHEILKGLESKKF